MAYKIRTSKREEASSQLSFLLCSTAIIWLGFFLRLYNIGKQELWLDEAASFHKVTSPNWLISYALSENTPPLYYLFLRGWTNLSGESELSLRFPSVIFGTLTIAAIIWLGREFLNSLVGLWSGLFAAISPIHIYYSQEARAYSLLILGLTISYTLLWFALKREGWVYWWLFSASVLLALYSHYSALLGLLPTVYLVWIFPGQLNTPNKWYRYGITSGLALLLFMPWTFGSFFVSKHSLAGTTWITTIWENTPPFLAIPKTLEVFGFGSHKYFLPLFLKQFTYLEYPSSLRWLGLGTLCLLGIVAILPYWENYLTIPFLRKRKIWLGITLFLPLLVLWLISFIKPIYVVGRYDMVAFSVFPLIVGLALTKLQSSRSFGLLLAVGVFTLYAIPLVTKQVQYYQATATSSAKDSAFALHTYVQNGDVVVFTGLRGLPIIYYLHQLGYEWNDKRCLNQDIGRHFACRMYPQTTEKSPAVLDSSDVENSPPNVQKEIHDFMNNLQGQDNNLWVVFNLPLHKADVLFIKEVEALGFQAFILRDNKAVGIFQYRKPER